MVQRCTTGAVTMAAKAKTAGEVFLDGPACPQVLKVSKHLRGKIRLLPGERCWCECKEGQHPQRVAQVRYRAVLKLDTAQPCDETELEPLLQGGTELWLEGEFTLRDDKCPQDPTTLLIGCNNGKFILHRYRPNEDVMQDSFCGTEGVLPTAEGPKRCCAPGVGIGTFCG